MTESCIFCKIVDGELPSTQLYQDELVTAFRDLHPVAPTHILIVPNAHLASTNDLTPEHAEAAGRMLTLVPELARQEDIAESGYRLVMNTGADGRQEVPHMHLHLIGGRRMQHPLG
ncbi:MAG: histidine triad nucleotide-binding protein [Anaerolineales bacterium]|nr:histidine triad nucleotide-binding protein [Anaerolineales bacterium]